MPEWWVTGWLIGLTIFVLLLLGLCMWMIRWGRRRVDEMYPRDSDPDVLKHLPP